MYESPIELIVKDTYQKILEQREENIFKAIFETGVKVDKEELLKALKYDREQYNKGYMDGAKEFAERLKEYSQPIRLSISDNRYNTVVSAVLIDIILKEMVGGAE